MKTPNTPLKKTPQNILLKTRISCKEKWNSTRGDPQGVPEPLTQLYTALVKALVELHVLPP